MAKLTVTAFTTLDNVAEEPQLWSGRVRALRVPEDGTRHTLRILELELLEGGMLALRTAPAAA